MLDLVCRLLNELGNADNGVECVLTQEVFETYKEIIHHLYGDVGSEVFEFGWTQREDGGMVVSMEDFGDYFYLKVFQQEMKKAYNG